MCNFGIFFYIIYLKIKKTKDKDEKTNGIENTKK